MTDFIGTELQKFKMSDAAIAKMSEDFMALKLKDVTDKEGYAAIKGARLFVKGKRVEVEKTRKALKADSLAFGRAVDGEAKRLTALLEPIESHLAGEQAVVDKMIEKAKREEAARQALPMRKERLANEGLTIPEEELLQMTIEDFEQKIFILKQNKVEEQARQQEASAAAMMAEQEKIEEEKRMIEIEKRKVEQEKQRIVDIEAAKKQAAEDARQAVLAETKAKIERERLEAEAAIERERKAKEEQARLEEMKPEKEKMLAYMLAVEAVPIPEILGELSKLWRSFLDAQEYNMMNVQDMLNKEG